MFDCITIGSATLDIFLRSTDFVVTKKPDKSEVVELPYDSKLSVEDFAMQSGGGATNVAVGVARLGFRTACIAEIGRDLAAEAVLSELKQESVDTALIIREKSEYTAISALLITKDGGRTAVTARGAAYMLTPSDVDLEKLRAHWIHLSSLKSLDVVLAVSRHAKKHHIPFSWNPGGNELRALADGELHPHEIHPTVFFVNEEEAAILKDAGYQLETAGATVIVTRGKRGAQVYDRGEWTPIPALPAKGIVQATGAGDGFISGVIGAYLSDRITEEAVEWGMRNAISVIQHMGAKTGLLRRKEIEK